jgi:hypothetical protein
MSDPQHPIVVQSPGVIGFASETVGALRSTPLLLVMVLLNCAFIGGAAFYLRIQQDNVYKLVDKMLDRCLNAKSGLVLPPSRGDYLPSNLAREP